MTLPDKITVRCCGCKGDVTFQRPTDDLEDHPTLYHTIPYCKRFEDVNTLDDLADYVRDCRRAQEN